MRVALTTIVALLVATMSRSSARIDEDIPALPGDYAISGADSPVDVAIRRWLESVRAVMHVGVPELGIAVLDPLSIDHYATVINFQLIKLELTVDDLLVMGLSNFTVGGVRADLETLQADFAIYFPHLHISGLYGFQSDLGLVSGNGSFTLRLDGVATRSRVQLTAHNETAQVSRFDMDFSVEKVKVALENLTGGGATGELVNHLLMKYKVEVAAYLSGAIALYVNPVLERIPLTEMLDAMGIPRT